MDNKPLLIEDLTASKNNDLEVKVLYYSSRNLSEEYKNYSWCNNQSHSVFNPNCFKGHTKGITYIKKSSYNIKATRTDSNTYELPVFKDKDYLVIIFSNTSKNKQKYTINLKLDDKKSVKEK